MELLVMVTGWCHAADGRYNLNQELHMYKIEAGIPRLLTREERYPFTALAVGESFQFQLHEVQEIRSASQWVGKKRGLKFSVRKVKAEGIGRCWRVA